MMAAATFRRRRRLHHSSSKLPFEKTAGEGRSAAARQAASNASKRGGARSVEDVIARRERRDEWLEASEAVRTEF